MINVRGASRFGVSALWVRTIALSALKAARCPNADASVSFITDAQIARLNEQYRGKKGPTDVLAFPVESVGLKGEARELGDICISTATAKKKAALRQEPYRQYLTLLIVHGILHLLGYDHERASDAKHMEREERRILHALP